jgi:hypothetical protein
MEYVITNKEKVRQNKDSFGIAQIPANFNLYLGTLIDKSIVVIDIDSESDKARFFIDKLHQSHPSLVITKTSKAGGYHLWFKTDENIKRKIGLVSMFGWPFDILTGVNNYVMLPINYEKKERSFLYPALPNQIESLEKFDAALADTPSITEEQIFEMFPYMYKDGAHPTPLDLKEGERNAGLMEWFGYCASQGIHVETMRANTELIEQITGVSKQECEKTFLSSIDKYQRRDKEKKSTDDLPTIKGDTLVNVIDELCVEIKERELIKYDIDTGSYYFNYLDHKNRPLSRKDFENAFCLYFDKKLFVYSHDENGIRKDPKEIPTPKKLMLVDSIIKRCEFSSRSLLYDALPEWDGIPRNNSFLHDYYACESNPHFWWLFLTCILGKMKNPKQYYAPFFFDMVSSSHGTGKSLLPVRLVGQRYTEMIGKNTSEDYRVTPLYDNNTLIAVDDECNVTGRSGYGTMDFETFKQWVTRDHDTFARKFQQPITLPRGFVIYRTCNDVKTVFDIEERRQIIFECQLPEKECRLLDLPDSYFQQMLAEAKIYLEEKGIYQMTDEDWSAMSRQQRDNYNTDTVSYSHIEAYIMECIKKIKIADPYEIAREWIKDERAEQGYFISWQTYRCWCESNGTEKPLESRVFWREMVGVISKRGWAKFDCVGKRKVDGLATKVAHLILDAKIEILDEKPTYAEIIIEKPTEKTATVESDEGKGLQKTEIRTDTSVSAKELKAVRQSFTDTNQFDVANMASLKTEGVRNFFAAHKDKADTALPTAIEVGGIPITYGLGGLHYGKQYKGRDLAYVDVVSMYPNIMIQYNLLSRAVPDPTIFEKWVRERMAAKDAGDTIKEQELKLKINSVYGLMKADWCALYDPHHASSVCVIGQILLTILIEQLQELGCEIINANTDGIMFMPVGNWQDTCRQWQASTGLKLKAKKIDAIYQSDVNNYTAIINNEIVKKGVKYIKRTDADCKSMMGVR